jgi:hypothetical protein
LWSALFLSSPSPPSIEFYSIVYYLVGGGGGGGVWGLETGGCGQSASGVA